MVYFLFLVLGLAGLWAGATLVVEAAKRIATALKISQTLVGLTIISIGTSLPEIATNIKSGLIGASGIAIGTNLGSDITQITFILGFTALVGTMYASKNLFKRDGPMVLLSIILVFIVGITGFKITWFEGVILALIYFFYLYTVSKDEKVLEKIKGDIVFSSNHKDHRWTQINSIIMMAFGIFLLIYASDFVVKEALGLAELWGVSQSFIGVLIIGVGTGLPELTTAITAMFKKAGDISLGTLIGSNITDPMLSLPLGAMFAGSAGLVFDKNLLFFDIPFWFIASIIALLLFKHTMKIGKADKKEGFILIFLYVLFVFVKIKFFMY
jgi:cation:H+ antiporter|tara:strand:+ start:585 stop:1562 length:978 start_codon:yes stop_codon:yes gene_type:complete